VTPAERKAVGYLIRQASDLFAAGAGNASIWSKRDHMRESIAQPVEEAMALFDAECYLAEILVAANQPQERNADDPH
jgi:hypothetical protein